MLSNPKIQEITEESANDPNTTQSISITHNSSKKGTSSTHFSFRSLNKKAGERFVPDSIIQVSELKTSLMKWGFQDTMNFARFSYDPYLHASEVDSFLESWIRFAAPLLPVLTDKGEWRVLGSISDNGYHALEYQPIQCTATSLALFDPLYEEGVVLRTEKAYIAKCFEETTEDFELVSDNLQQVLLNPSFEHYDLLEPSTRSEFITSILTHLVRGGNLCQYEDEAIPYFDMVKAIYKEMICVEKYVDEKGKHSLRVASKVFKVTGILPPAQGPILHLFPQSQRDANPSTKHRNFMYVAIDPVKRHINVWYNAVLDF